MAKISPGFDFDEMRTLLEIAQQAYVGIPPTPGAPPVPDPPSNWQLDTSYTPSGPTVLSNFWQVWNNQDQPNQYAIAIRGTVQTAPSILEDLLFPLMKARVSLSLEACGLSTDLDLFLARDEGDSAVVAGVHVGFTLGLLSILFTTNKPLFLTLLELPADAEIYITGHSQGASVATLLTSFVRHSSLLSKLYSSRVYKTYVFAQAQPGNDHYAYDYDQVGSVPGYAFTAASTQDWVPQVPFTLQGLRAINTPNPIVPFSGKTFDDAATPDANAPADLKELSVAEAEAVAAAKRNLEQQLDRARADLAKATFTVPVSRLTASPAAAGNDQLLGSDCFASILDQLKDLLLPSLNYTAAGQVVPAFAVPGANPKDPSDAFWQHHLGNYLKYLTEQYGP